MSAFTAADLPSQQHKCFLVTGANTGLGFEVSRELAARGARVILACRDRAKAEAAMMSLGRSVAGTDLAFLPLEQADLASIRRAAEVADREPRTDVLVNNAGVMIPPLGHTRHGFELQFGINHLGCFALTGLLLPKLARSPAPRVVITAGLTRRQGSIDWDDLDARGATRPDGAMRTAS